MAKNSPALVLVLALIVCSAARAQTAAPTAVPDPKPDLSSMSYLIGTWSCQARLRGSSRPDTLDQGQRFRSRVRQIPDAQDHDVLVADLQSHQERVGLDGARQLWGLLHRHLAGMARQ